MECECELRRQTEKIVSKQSVKPEPFQKNNDPSIAKLGTTMSVAPSFSQRKSDRQNPRISGTIHLKRTVSLLTHLQNHPYNRFQSTWTKTTKT